MLKKMLLFLITLSLASFAYANQPGNCAPLGTPNLGTPPPRTSAADGLLFVEARQLQAAKEGKAHRRLDVVDILRSNGLGAHVVGHPPYQRPRLGEHHLNRSRSRVVVRSRDQRGKAAVIRRA